MRQLRFVVALVALAAALAGCEPDFNARATEGDIAFSVDTVSFDTIVCGEVSGAMKLTLRNNSGEDITIDRLSLVGGVNSPFGININGREAPMAGALRLRHSDSLQVFLNVARPQVRQGRAVTPLFDRVEAQSGSAICSAVVAAHILNLRNITALRIEGDVVWDNDTIPYNIVDSVVVAPGASLTATPGVRILFNPVAYLAVEGRLTLAGGDNEERQTRLGPHRQDEFYKNVPGQWQGVELRAGSRADLSNAELSCATYGLRCLAGAKLSANACRLRDISHQGIQATDATVELSNCIVDGTGGSCVEVTRGATRLTHCTLAEYYIWDRREAPTLKVHTPAEGEAVTLEVVNTIVTGNQYAEVEVDTVAAAGARFRNSFVRVDKAKDFDKHPECFVNCLTDDHIEFADIDKCDYHLTQDSPALGKADATVAGAYPLDYEGEVRVPSRGVQPGALDVVKGRD